MPSAKHCIGVIGLGSIGRRHATNLWKNLGQTEVIGYDIELKDKVGWIISDLDMLIKMATAVVICSPTENHFEHFMMVHEAGKPMFIEKPIFATQLEYDKIIPGVWASGTLPNVKMVGYNLRFHPCVRQAKEWLDAGDIGDPLWANFTLGQRSIKPPYLRDGVILNWSHEIDLALHLLGPGRVGHSNTRISDGRDDLTDIGFVHNTLCMSTIHLDYLTQPETRQSIIVGTEGQIIMDLVHHQAWLRDKDGGIIDKADAPLGWDGTYLAEMENFLSCLDGAPVAGCTAEESLKVLEVCLEVRKQAEL